MIEAEISVVKVSKKGQPAIFSVFVNGEERGRIEKRDGKYYPFHWLGLRDGYEEAGTFRRMKSAVAEITRTEH